MTTETLEFCAVSLQHIEVQITDTKHMFCDHMLLSPEVVFLFIKHTQLTAIHHVKETPQKREYLHLSKKTHVSITQRTGMELMITIKRMSDVKLHLIVSQNNL